MSFILDALKKSETERQQQGQSAFAHVPAGGSDRRPPAWLWALGALLLINLAVLTGLLLRPSAPAAPAAAEVDPSTEPQALAPEPRFEDRVRDAINSRPATPAESAPAFESTPPPVATAVSTEPVVETVSRTAEAPATTDLPDIDQLRARGELPIGDLRLDIHVYSDNPDDRFVFINMVKHREGSSTSDGLVVRSITQDGVILNYRGADFVLPRQ